MGKYFKVECTDCKRQMTVQAKDIGRICPKDFCSGTLIDAASDADPVNHPPHYTSSPAKCKCGEGIECIQITEHMNFNIGNAIKYLWRASSKGKTIEDYKKAMWYITREIARLEKE